MPDILYIMYKNTYTNTPTYPKSNKDEFALLFIAKREEGKLMHMENLVHIEPLLYNY